MADVIIRGVTYSGVATVSIQADGGGTETFLQPSGAISITDNGVVDVTDYASAVVSVSGGGGGPTASDAILLVTVPAGSVVTMTKGADTRVPTMWVSAADATLEKALFVVEAADFDSTAWTVTAISGLNTATATVVINSAAYYTESLLAKIYLVKDGILNSTFDISQGTGTLANVSQESGYVAFNVGNQARAAVFSAHNTVDLTTFTTMKLVVTGGQSYYASGKVPALAVGQSRPITSTGTSAGIQNIDAATMLRSSTGTISAGTYALDVSSLNGEYYLAISVADTANISGNEFINVYDWWLE